MDAGETLGYDGLDAEVAGLHRRVLAARALAIIVLRHDDAASVGVAQFGRALRDGSAGHAREGVSRAQQEVLRDVLQMPAETQPGPGHGDVVRGAFSCGLDKQGQVEEIAAVPGRERLEALYALAGGIYFRLGAVRDGSLIAGSAGGEAARREFIDAGGFQSRGQRETPAEGEGNRHLGRHDECVGVGIAVRTLREIAVERGHDGVRPAGIFFRDVALPLADAGAAGVGHHRGSGPAQYGQKAVALGRRLDALAAGIDDDGGLGLHAGVQRGLRHGGRGGQVLIRRVRTRAYQADFHLLGESFLRHAGGHLRQRARRIGRERAVHIGLQFGEIDLYHPVVVLLGGGQDFVVRPQVLLVHDGHGGHGRTACGLQVCHHLGVEGEYRAGRTHFRTHVADGGLAGAGDGLGAVSEVFYDGVGPALDGQDACQFEYHVLGGSPSGEASSEFHAYELGDLEFPVHPGHHVHGVGPADTDGEHSKASGIGRMRVSTHHHSSGECIVLKDYLVDDAGSRLPETHSVARSRGGKEAIDLAVGPAGLGEVGLDALAGADEVVAVYGGRGADALLAGVHELEDGHLGRRVLHGHAVRAEAGVTAPRRFRRAGLVQMREKYLLGKSEGPGHRGLRNLHPGSIRFVMGPDHVNVVDHG